MLKLKTTYPLDKILLVRCMIEIFYLSVTANILFMYVIKSMRFGMKEMYLDSLQVCKYDCEILHFSRIPRRLNFENPTD